jgi:hypothetical protein
VEDSWFPDTEDNELIVYPLNFHPNLGSGGLSALAVKVAAVPTVRVAGPLTDVTPIGVKVATLVLRVPPVNMYFPV